MDCLEFQHGHQLTHSVLFPWAPWASMQALGLAESPLPFCTLELGHWPPHPLGAGCSLVYPSPLAGITKGLPIWGQAHLIHHRHQSCHLLIAYGLFISGLSTLCP